MLKEEKMGTSDIYYFDGTTLIYSIKYKSISKMNNVAFLCAVTLDIVYTMTRRFAKMMILISFMIHSSKHLRT